MKDLNFIETILDKTNVALPLKKHESFQYAPAHQPASNNVFDIIKSRIIGQHRFNLDCDQEDAFYVADMGEVVRQHLNFKNSLPRVEPFYAVKCNPDPMVLRTLNAQGTGFDCASKGEMQAVLEMGVCPSRIIYANPCKQISHLRFAASKHIRMLTFDNFDELGKIAQYHPSAQLVLRILTDDSRSLCKLGLKFGATLDTVSSLLQQAKELDLEVIGISFHVGSGCFDATAFGDAVKRAKKAFEIGAKLGYKFSFLDIGGGFPGSLSILIPVLDVHFPSDIRIIAEPGRYYVSAAFTLSVNITSRRTLPNPEGDSENPLYMYYVNDGMYGSFNCITFDHSKPKAGILIRNGSFVYGQNTQEENQFLSSIWGPTCDSIDCIGSGVMLPALNVGDWLVYEDMGAYTMAAASTFNGFKRSTIIYTNTEL